MTDRYERLLQKIDQLKFETEDLFNSFLQLIDQAYDEVALLMDEDEGEERKDEITEEGTGE